MKTDIQDFHVSLWKVPNIQLQFLCTKLMLLSAIICPSYSTVRDWQPKQIIRQTDRETFKLNDFWKKCFEVFSKSLFNGVIGLEYHTLIQRVGTKRRICTKIQEKKSLILLFASIFQKNPFESFLEPLFNNFLPNLEAANLFVLTSAWWQTSLQSHLPEMEVSCIWNTNIIV